MSSNMDQSAELPFDLDQEFNVLSGQECNDLLSILRDDVGDLTPPPAPSRPIVPAGMDGCAPLGAAPLTFEQLNISMAPQRLDVGPGPLCNQAGSYSQGQYNNVPVVQGLFQNLPIAGVLNGQVLYKLPESVSSFSSAAPPPNTVKTTKRKCECQRHDGPYVKKPPNAFLLFMKEQRPNCVAAMNTSRMSVVNTVLGQKWKSLSNAERAKYQKQAEIGRRLHAERHPGWSNRNNYGKRKRDRSQAAIYYISEDHSWFSASTSGEVTQQCVTSVYTGVVEAPPTHTYVTEPPTQKASEMEIQLQGPYSDSLSTVDVSSFTPLLDEYESFCFDSTTTASAAMESPAAPAESGDLDLAKELEALIAGLMETLPLESEPQPLSLTDIFPEEDQTEARWFDPWVL